MPDHLHWETVTPLLRSALTTLMESDQFKMFRLVGGTSLSLQLGHRKSDDIDLFTDAEYDSVDFDAVDKFLRDAFPYVSPLQPGPVGMGTSYLIGDSEDDTVKLDLFYTTDPFIEEALTFGPYRLASTNEITAMKIDVVQRKGRKKDFWDLHELFGHYSLDRMLELHEIRYPYTHDAALIKNNLTHFEDADDDFDPNCLRGKHWELIKLTLVRIVSPNKKPDRR